MAEDDDIARLLREVEAATSGTPASSAAQPAASPAALPAAQPKAGAEVATGKESGTGRKIVIAGAAGALVGLLAAWIFGVIPFLGNSDTLRFVLAGFVGGAVGYGAGHLLDRRDR
jgi:hypothetical protein